MILLCCYVSVVSVVSVLCLCVMFMCYVYVSFFSPEFLCDCWITF